MPSALPTGETWFHHVVVHYPGVVTFLFLDAVIFIAATTLTVAQASQVIVKTVSVPQSSVTRYSLFSHIIFFWHLLKPYISEDVLDLLGS